MSGSIVTDYHDSQLNEGKIILLVPDEKGNRKRHVKGRCDNNTTNRS